MRVGSWNGTGRKTVEMRAGTPSRTPLRWQELFPMRRGHFFARGFRFALGSASGFEPSP